jgi:UrcA family protein
MLFRPITAASIVLGALTAWAGIAQAGPHIVYTHHTLKLDFHDLDLSRPADQRVLQGRIADAADQVCGGRPDKTNRYSAEELKLLVPAYETCRTDAMRHAVAVVSAASGMRFADAGGP